MRCRTLLLVCFLFNIHSTMRGQSPNPCGVVAVLSPSGDSIVTSPTAVYFQSASINATSYKIIIDVYDLGMNAPINWGIQPGLTKVILVAYNGSCTDTAIAYYFYAGQYPSVSDNPRNLYGYANRDQSMTGFLNVGAGGYIISGHRDASNFFNEQQQGLIIKTKQAGCVGWAKKIGGKFSSDVTHVKESTDGGFFIASELDGKNAIAKFDLTGNVQWSKEIVATDGNDLAPIGLEALPGGGVAVAGIYNYVKLAIARLDNSGAIVWQHEYDYNAGYTGQFANLLYKNNALYVGGNLNYNNFTNYDPFLTKIDFASGQTIWMKKYLSATGGLVFRNMLDVDSTIVINIAGATGTNNIPVIGGFMRLDTSGQVLGAKLIAENYIPNTLVGPYGAGGMQLIRSGKTFYMISSGSELLSLQPGITFLFKIAKIDSSYNVEWVESNGGVVVPIFNFDAPAPVDGLAIGGTEGGSGFSPNSLGSMFSLKHIDSSGGNPSASCFFGKQDFVIVPLTISVQPDNWTIDVTGSSLSSSFSLPIANFFPEMRIKCPD
ncbi:MAG TPA: hypothetical protein VK588_06365, partial [Chitinophagaceae bacterium]|nr:hypothetical protein [Chitinophagaceae bacterium]